MRETAGGYVAVHRALLEHPLVTQFPPAWFRIFIVILLKTNWKPARWWDGTKEVTIPAGSFVTSIEKLSKIAKVSAKQTRGCLQYLSTAKTAAIKTTSHYTVITLLKWDAYQGFRNLDGKPEDEPNNKGQSEGKRSADSGRGNGEPEGKPDGKQNIPINGADTSSSVAADSVNGEARGEPNGKAGAKQGQAVGTREGNNLISNNNQSIREEEQRYDDSDASRKSSAKTTELLGRVVPDTEAGQERKDETLLRWTLEEFVAGSEYLTGGAPDDVISDLLRILGAQVGRFIEHVGAISQRFRPGGSMEFRKWGAFISTARNLAAIPAPPPILRMDHCRHDLPDGACPQCSPRGDNEARMEDF